MSRLADLASSGPPATCRGTVRKLKGSKRADVYPQGPEACEVFPQVMTDLNWPVKRDYDEKEKKVNIKHGLESGFRSCLI